MRKAKTTDLVLMVLTLAIVSSVVLADESITVTFKVPSAISFSAAYAGSCDSADFAFVESDATKDGTQTHINVTQIDGTACQSASIAAINLTNTGNTNINITGIFTAALPSGVTVKVSQVNSGYQTSCSEAEPPTADCVTLATASKTLVSSLAADNSQELWWWCDMSSFNSGAAGQTTRTLNLTSVES